MAKYSDIRNSDVYKKAFEKAFANCKCKLDTRTVKIS